MSSGGNYILEKASSMTYESIRQAGALEITTAMIEAGVYAAREHCIGAPLADLVRVVAIAILTEADQTRAAASSMSLPK